MTEHPARRDMDIDAFWNGLVRGENPDAGTLDSETTTQIRDMYRLLHSQIPAGAGERLHAAVMTELHQRTIAQNGKGTNVDAPLNPAGTFIPALSETLTPGRVKAQVGRARFGNPLRSAALFVSTAAIALTLAFLLYLFIQPGSKNNTAYPPLQETATPAAIDASSQDWPVFRQDPGRTGATDAEGPQENPKLQWQVQLTEGTVGTPIVVDGVLYVASGDGMLHAFRATDGEVLWTTLLGVIPTSSLAFFEGQLIFTDEDQLLLGFDARDGVALWSLPLLGKSGVGPIVEGVMYTVATDGQVHAVEIETGTSLWSVTVGIGESRQMAAGDGMLFVSGADKRLSALDSSTGQLIWENTSNFNGAVGTPAFRDGVVYASNTDGGERYLFAFDAATGDLLWNKINVDAQEANLRPVSIGATTVFVGSQDGQLYAFDTKTGDKRFTFAAGDSIPSPSVLSANSIYFASDDGNLYAVDATTGDEQWRFGLADVMLGPVVSDGLIFVVTDDGLLCAIGSGEPET